LTLSVSDKRRLIEADANIISISRQCELLGISRSGLYYQPAEESPENLSLMKKIDEQYIKTPFYGSRRMAAFLKKEGEDANRKRVQRLMRLMGIEAIYPKPRTTIKSEDHKIYPYLLQGVSIVRPNQVWSTDITYIRTLRGFLYLVAIIDWYSRYILSWGLSNTLDRYFCIEALKEALDRGKPEIFNSDQGSQFTSVEFTGILKAADVKISMDGRGRVFDNIFVERLWRTIKYEEVYIKDYEDGPSAYKGLSVYIPFYNDERLHQSLNYLTPSAIYHGVSN
jgi:putative transposase